MCHLLYLEQLKGHWLKDLIYQVVDIGMLGSSLVVKSGDSTSVHAFETPTGWSATLQGFEEELLEAFSA